MKYVSKKKEFFLSQKEILTEDIFAKLELDLEFLAQEEQSEKRILTLNFFIRREEERRIGLRIILSKRVTGRKGVGLRIICPSKKREEKNKASQKRSEESRPLNGKEIDDRVRFPDRLQKNSMLPFHATNRKSVCTKHVSSRSQ